MKEEMTATRTDRPLALLYFFLLIVVCLRVPINTVDILLQISAAVSSI